MCTSQSSLLAMLLSVLWSNLCVNNFNSFWMKTRHMYVPQHVKGIQDLGAGPWETQHKLHWRKKTLQFQWVLLLQQNKHFQKQVL
uniref:Secreted protein n=1 Tax=Coturnix japonica TaxID=93934 RepID=A0A8C2SZP1_COTJA